MKRNRILAAAFPYPLRRSVETPPEACNQNETWEFDMWDTSNRYVEEERRELWLRSGVFLA